MTLDSVLVILRAIIDISLVWMVIYFILKNIKNNVKMILLFKGVFVVLIIEHSFILGVAISALVSLTFIIYFMSD